MTRLAGRLGQPRERNFKPPPVQAWGLTIGGIIAILGLFVLLLNLPAGRLTPRPVTTPIVIRDGLIVAGSDARVYLFKKYTLHQILDPTPAQRARAQPVSDTFLGQYTQGEPVNAQGQPAAGGPDIIQPAPGPGPLVVSLASGIKVIYLLASCLAVILGGGWLLLHLSRPSPQDCGLRQEAYLHQADLYISQIEQLLKARPDQWQGLLPQIRTWRQALADVVQGMAAFEQNELIQRDLVEVPQALADLERQLTAETDPARHARLAHTLGQRRQQQAVLAQLQAAAAQAETQVEVTLSLLGTLYSQLLTQQSSTDLASYNHWLRQADEQVQCLQDYLEALREVKLR